MFGVEVTELGSVKIVRYLSGTTPGSQYCKKTKTKRESDLIFTLDTLWVRIDEQLVKHSRNFLIPTVQSAVIQLHIITFCIDEYCSNWSMNIRYMHAVVCIYNYTAVVYLQISSTSSHLQLQSCQSYEIAILPTHGGARAHSKNSAYTTEHYKHHKYVRHNWHTDTSRRSELNLFCWYTTTNTITQSPESSPTWPHTTDNYHHLQCIPYYTTWTIRIHVTEYSTNSQTTIRN